MSHGRHNASSEVAHLVAEVRQMTAEQALESYGLVLPQWDTFTTAVYDTAYEQEFKNINEWAKYVIAQEMLEDDEDDQYAGKWNDDE